MQIWMNCVVLWPQVSYEVLLIYRVTGLIKWVLSYETPIRVPQYCTKLGTTTCNYHFISGQTQCCLIPCSITGEMGRCRAWQDWARAYLAIGNSRSLRGWWHIGIAVWTVWQDGQLILMLQERKEGILTVQQNLWSATSRFFKTYLQGHLVADSRSWGLRLESRDLAIFRHRER